MLWKFVSVSLQIRSTPSSLGFEPPNQSYFDVNLAQHLGMWQLDAGSDFD